MKKIIWIIITGLIAYGVLHLKYVNGLKPVDADDVKRISITIEEGWSLSRIADELEEKGIIRSDSSFRKLVKSLDLAESLKTGEYVLDTSMTAEEIAEVISQGQSSEEKVTIPEGFTVGQIDALLAEKGFGEPGDIMHCAFTCDFATFDFLPDQNFGSEDDGYGSKLEGYAYPDTYFVARGDYHPKFLLERMLGTFRARVIDEFGDEIGASGHSLHEVITMASLIEEETRTPAERPIISGILWKRFDRQMGLDVDATVRYVTANITNEITRAQLQTDSPYNTRRYRGLPPGPIANPSIASIEAALSPQDSPYYYYLHGSDGVVRYARTNDEHNVNKAKYLK